MRPECWRTDNNNNNSETDSFGPEAAAAARGQPADKEEPSTVAAQEAQRQNRMQGDIKNTSLELSRTKTKEKHLAMEIADLKHQKKSLEEE